MNFQNFVRARKGSVTSCSLWSLQTGLCPPGGGQDKAVLRIVVRNCMFLSLAEAEQCRVWEGSSLAGSLTVHIPVLPAHYGTLLHWQVLQSGWAGSQESLPRHIPAFLGQQLLPQHCPCHGKGSWSHHSTQCVPQPCPIAPCPVPVPSPPCTPAQRELAFQTKLSLYYSWSLATTIADFTIILQRTLRNIKLLV